METERFTPHAQAYAGGRPGYAPAVVAALFAGAPPSDATVADLGAGTGISSRALAAAGARVFAIEPNAAMREAAQQTPGIVWVAGSAEATTLPDASVDLAVAFQAWHWFDAAAALREARRIVRPGGGIAVVAYERDERDAVTAAYDALVRAFALEETEARRAAALAAFATLPGAARAEVPSVQHLDRGALDARVAGTSYLPQDGPRGMQLREGVAAFFASHAKDGHVSLHLTTTVVRIPR